MHACGLHVHSRIRKPLYINTGHTWRCLLMACVLHACALKQLALLGKPIYEHWPHMEVFASGQNVDVGLPPHHGGVCFWPLHANVGVGLPSLHASP